MQKAEYRYYEISRDIPVLVLTGEKWETIYGTDNMHFHNYLEIGYCHYGKGTVQLADRELTYDAGTITFIPHNFRTGHVRSRKRQMRSRSGNICLLIPILF